MWWLLLRSAHLALRAMSYAYFLALMLLLLAFTTRLMVRSVHLALSPIRFTAQLDFDSDSYEKMHTASLVRRHWLISALYTTTSPRLKARAWCGDLRWDESISPFPRFSAHTPANTIMLIWTSANVVYVGPSINQHWFNDGAYTNSRVGGGPGAVVKDACLESRRSRVRAPL